MEWTKQHRQIFRYHDGNTYIYGDPLAIESALIEALGDLTPLLEKINKTNAAQADALTLMEGVQARHMLIDGCRAAFKMARFEQDTGKGATDDMVLGTYLAWVSNLKNRVGNTGGAARHEKAQGLKAGAA